MSTRLVGLDELGEDDVVEVRTEEHGTLAVGMAGGEPFAVSNVCRHQFAKLGRGQGTNDGCLECPWHRARYDVRTGKMRSGPKGRIWGLPPYSRVIQAFTNILWDLDVFAVEIRGGAIYLRS